MSAHVDIKRERYLAAIASAEDVSIAELGAESLSTRWLWLLDAGDMVARARSGKTQVENLPGSPTQVVEIIRKPYALIEYTSPEEATRAIEMDSPHAMLAYANQSLVAKILATLHPQYPEPRMLSKGTYEFSNGLILIHDFITQDEELEMIHEYRLAAVSSDGRLPKRGALHFGPHFDYTTFAVSSSESTPPPTYLTRLLDRLPIRDERDVPDQYTLQYYPPGTGIPPHVDTHSAFEESIYSLSFGASTAMDFRLCGEKESRRIKLPKRSLGGSVATPPQSVSPTPDEEVEEWELELPARSLLIMRGPSRYGFSHGIKGRKFDQRGTHVVARRDRYSLTMRKIKPPDKVGCDCLYSHVCT